MLLLTLNMNMFNFVIDDSFNDYFDSISTDIAFIQEACSRPHGQIHMNSCVYPANTNGISIDFITKFVYNFVIK